MQYNFFEGIINIFNKKLIKDNDVNNIIWTENISVNKEADIKTNFEVTLLDNTKIKVPTTVHIYDIEKMAKTLDNMIFYDTRIVDRFNEKYFFNVNSGPVISIIDKAINKNDLNLEKVIGGVELGFGIKVKENINIVPFFEY